MKRLLSGAVALSLALPITMTAFVDGAQARHGRHYAYKEWRGRDGRVYCRKSDGTVGLVIGAVGGALVGRAIDTRGDRTVGTLLGAAAGGYLGHEVASKRRCR